ncbi:exodeoxyribonuclease V, beta subunit [Buchnera aphidicola (Nipponaphis monzeni)]|uniref:RecBCD enzyme subunit RecB n=1 Tax=Buchnera aphidicola (Nipponaphis monzeni) TaxID=2495405 RepID=A0A455TAK1_9GAMM|nr:exodeoxyribonuclease V subunit beta [Buchnera aphidicola]BBI01348.1 exodeoxyribonuclease V, beta subunit [Buchnera aphidicola (Nipponaphis monzeni)]
MNKLKKPTLIDILNSPITGEILIQASAGTGKTFCIIIFYLRLLLNIKCNYQSNKYLSVQEILVLTFTNKSKDELIIRIKENIHTLKNICEGKPQVNKVLNKLFQNISNIPQAITVLQIAESNLKNAAIFTIHKFCQNIIYQNIFHINLFHKPKIIDNEDLLYLTTTVNFWRKYCYTLPEEIIRLINTYWKEPKDLLKEIKPILIHKTKIYQSYRFKQITLIQYYENIINKIKSFKKKWNFIITKNNTFKQYLFNNITHSKKKVYNWINIITSWSHEQTKSFFIPKELLLLKKIFINKNIFKAQHSFLKTITIFLNNNFSIKEFFLYKSITTIRNFIKHEKKISEKIEINDLISIVYQSLNKNNNFLSNFIRKKFPVVLIDEFQDTSTQQYKIFETVYFNKKKVALILIADPKQSIYSFRGSNIFSYFKIYQRFKTIYYLNVNWRSSYKVIESINTLFSQFKNPFIFKNINFNISYANTCNKISFEIDNISQPGLSIFFKKAPIMCMSEYLNWSSNQCAYNIYNWLSLGKKKRAVIYIKNKKKFVEAKDITILVRNKQESNYITTALNKYNISSFYHSYKEDIYHQKETIEIFTILQAILNFNNINQIKQALLTTIISKTIYDIDAINNNINILSSFVSMFKNYFHMWEKKGIFYLIKQIIIDFAIKNFSANLYNRQKLLENVFKIADNLEYQSQFTNNQHTLLLWFADQINQSKNGIKNSYALNYNNFNNINITTIHKSKGLEYPLVWIPFLINFSKIKKCIFYNKINLTSILDLYNEKKNLRKSQKEHLSEEIRLIYVALTRSILHNSIAIAPVIKGTRSCKNSFTDIHNSGFGYLIQKGKKLSQSGLNKQLHTFDTNKNIKILSEKIVQFKKNIIIDESSTKIKLHTINKNIKDNWSIISFSKIASNTKNMSLYKEHYFKEKKILKYRNNKKLLNTHTFPRGKTYGKFLHKILKNCDFNKTANCSLITQELNKINLSQEWVYIIQSWIESIFNISLNTKHLILKNLEKQNYVKEFEFCLPLQKKINFEKINKLLKLYSPISKLSSNIKYDKVVGVLKGFIDVIFYWNKKYYIIDYKSNWIGKNNNCYTFQKIYKIIANNNYDLQYIIYSLSLHRHLKNKMNGYSFKKNFGGVFYLFIRAFNQKHKNNGIFFTLPSYTLIQTLDTLLK